ncbi:sensor histidine kinase [Paenibacillus fonticola]|uniref:sensor histidine kinase n=1 Tax=Paenibacillus fonticola TaxID=379896 RepID=UPI000360D943|nr:histidine kinase [Paenibacillus fonticola]
MNYLEKSSNGGGTLLNMPAKIGNSIFVRLVITYLVIIVPILFLGLYLYNWSYKNASEEISRNTKAQLTSYLADLNREIEWLEIQQFDILQDNELNKLVVTWEMMDSVERKASMNYLLTRLNSIKNSSNYIKDIYVHIRNLDKSVSSVNAVHEFETDKYNEMLSTMEQNKERLYTQDKYLYLSAPKFGGIKGAEPLYIVQIEVDTNKLKTSLEQLRIYPEGGLFLYSDQSGFSLGSDEFAELIKSYFIRQNDTEANTLLLFGSRKYLIVQACSEQLGLSAVAYLPEAAVKRPLTKFKAWVWIFAATSLLAIFIYSYSTYKLVHKPVLFLVQSFRRMEEGTLNIHIVHRRKDEFGYLYERFNLMLTKLQNFIDQDYKQKMMMQKAELKQLQSQINPHFLYNSFFILHSLAKTRDTGRIEQFTNMLGEYFRFITRNGNDNVYLSEEIRHSRMYTDIQTLRFSRRIRVQFDELPTEMERIQVPRLVIQPIIENAYEHSLEKMMDEGLLRITFEINSGEALIMIEDNGDRLEDSELEALKEQLNNVGESVEMTGMMNIHRRIVLIYGEGSGVFLSRSEWNGLKVVIRIQLKEQMGNV